MQDPVIGQSIKLNNQLMIADTKAMAAEEAVERIKRELQATTREAAEATAQLAGVRGEGANDACCGHLWISSWAGDPSPQVFGAFKTQSPELPRDSPELSPSRPTRDALCR